MAESLRAPWRIDYLRSLEKPAEGSCFLCDASKRELADYHKSLLLWKSEHCMVLINRFPYANGHLLIAPLAHIAEMDELSDAELLDLQQQTVRAMKLLRISINPHGFNVGINLGRCGGAGVPGHLHQHLVPRWNGDTNFIRVVGEVGVVPQAMDQLYEELTSAMQHLDAADSNGGLS